MALRGLCVVGLLALVGVVACEEEPEPLGPAAGRGGNAGAANAGGGTGGGGTGGEGVAGNDGGGGAGAGTGGSGGGAGGTAGGVSGEGGTAGGTAGASGASGASGAAGTSGAAGASGTSGASGASGGGGAGGVAGNPIVINEVVLNPSGIDFGCFIELKGPPGASLAGHVLRSVGGNGTLNSEFKFQAAHALDAKGYFVVAQDATVQLAAGAASVINAFADLQNGPDSLVLVNAGGAVLDALGYSAENGTFLPPNTSAGEGPFAVQPAGANVNASLARVPDGKDTNNNAADFKFGQRTPGAANTLANGAGPNSCIGHCDSTDATEGGCFCDDSCEEFDDCCADKIAVCGAAPAAPPLRARARR
jgi:somatomedin B domain-containing protein